MSDFGISNFLAVDTETTGLQSWNGDFPFVITAADAAGRAFFARLAPQVHAALEALEPALRVPELARLGRPGSQAWLVESSIEGLTSLDDLRAVIDDGETTLVFHNAKFDVPMLRLLGLNVDMRTVEDTMIIARLALPNSPRISLKYLARHLLKVGYESEDALKQWMRSHKTKRFQDVPNALLRPYAIDDAIYTSVLYQGLRQKVPSESLYAMELELLELVIRMESRGMKCDLKYAAEKAAWCRTNQRTIQAYADELNGGPINLNSPKQLQALLFDRLRLHETLSVEDKRRYGKILKTGKGLYSTKREALKVYDHPVVQLIMEYRMLGKMAGTYFEKFIELADSESVIHPSFWQCGTRTGRFSGSDPSFQTIPSVSSGRLLDFDRSKIPDVRHCFGSRPGYTLYAPDFSQIELRIAAWYAGDEVMIDAFTHNRDIHDETTKAIFPDDWEDPDVPGKIDKPKRTFCKMVNFGVLYGMGVGKLSSDLGVPVERAKRFLSRYFETYPGLHDLMKRCQRQIVTRGYVESIFGRRFRADPSESYKGLNYLIQGTAADVMKMTMLRVDRFFQEGEYDAHIINTVHDEILFEILTGQDDDDFHGSLQGVMQSWHEFDPVPLPVNCKVAIDRWGNHKEVW